MLHSRNATWLFLIVAIAGAALLWWNLADDPPPDAAPPSAVPAESDDAIRALEGAPELDDAPARVEATDDSSNTAASPSTKLGPSELHVRATWPDQTPAADVMIFLRSAVQRLSTTPSARGYTDANGLVVFKNAPPGPSRLVSDRQDSQKITVEGGRQEITFELKGGIAIRGTVKNPSGAPVANADVWLQSSNSTWTGGRVVSHTDAAGEFTLEQIPPKMSLGAVAADFAPSKLLDLALVDQSNLPAVIDLTLRPGAGRLEGTVTNAASEPIAGAVVAVGKNPSHLDYRGGRFIAEWTPRTAETDEHGFFAIDGLSVGAVPIAVRAAGYGLWRGRTTIEQHAVAVASPRLLRAATLIGTATDGEGVPVESAAIRAYDSKPGTDFLSGGQIDFSKTFGYRAAITGPDGKYRIEDVTPGTVHVFAQRAQERGVRDGVSVAYAQAQLDVEPGTETPWDPVIEDGAAIEGVVLYADGDPIPGLFITLAEEKEDGKEHVIASSSKGVFRFLCLEDTSYEIRVQAPFTAADDAPPIQAKGVFPSLGRTVLQATYNKPEKKARGHVIGRIDDVAGRIRNPLAATITLRSEANWFRAGNKVKNGAFRIENVRPGRFQLTLMENETAIAESEWFDLQPAATIDTGALTTGPAGSVRFVIERGEGTELHEPKLYLRGSGQKSATTIEVGRRDEVLADNLTPGDYRLTGHFRGMVNLRERIQVTAGETTTFQLALSAGARMQCDVWWPTGDVQSTSRKYRILNAADDSLLIEYESSLAGYPITRPHLVHANLPQGRWRVEFSTDDGLTGEVEFVVKNSRDKVKPRIDLAMRRGSK